MVSRKLYVALFAALLIFFVIIKLPMAFVMGFVDQRSGLKWTAAAGTVWNGTITGLRFHQYGIGDAKVSLKFLPLLRGRAAVAFELTGPALNADGVASMSRNRQFILRNSDVAIDLGGYDIRDAFGQKMFGTVIAAIDVLDLSPTGCRDGRFRIETTALRETLKRFKQDGFDLLGDGSCDNNNLLIPLAGSNGTEKVDIKTVLEPTLTYTANVTIETPNQDLKQALRAFRFVEQGGRLVLTQRGNFITNP